MNVSRVGGVLAALLALVPGSAFAAGEAFAPADFFRGRAIETQTSDALQTLLLDLGVYRGAVSPDLADLRVFNGAGEVVPHALRALADSREEESVQVEVPLFRVPEGSALARAGSSAMGMRTTVRERDIAIEIAADGAIVRVDSGAAAGEQAPSRPSAYLIDLSQLAKNRTAVVGLDLALAPEPAEFALVLRVEASEDLVHFDPLSIRGALARLDQAGHRIERNQIDLPRVTSRYLLLSAAQPIPVAVVSVRARLAPVIEPPPRNRERIAGASVEGERAEFLFDLGGPIPVDRVQVELPLPNTVIEAELYSAAQAEGPWLHHFSGLLYQLERGEGTLRNAEITVPPIRRRYFKLAVAEKGGGLGGGTPWLEAAWVPEQLLFVARGAGPFALGYGRAQVDPARFDAAELIRSALPPGAEVPRETARLGSAETTGDSSVLEPRREPTPRRTIALWAVLVVSVAIVLALSVRLIRRMDSSHNDVGFQ
jgi:hypothetical protein